MLGRALVQLFRCTGHPPRGHDRLAFRHRHNRQDGPCLVGRRTHRTRRTVNCFLCCRMAAPGLWSAPATPVGKVTARRVRSGLTRRRERNARRPYASASADSGARASPAASRLSAGNRSAITVLLGFSLGFFRFWGFEASGEWAPRSIIAAGTLVVAILLQIVALVRSLRLEDDDPNEYLKDRQVVHDLRGRIADWTVDRHGSVRWHHMTIKSASAEGSSRKHVSNGHPLPSAGDAGR